MGRSKGTTSSDEEIQGALSDIDLTDDQVERIYSHFATSGIDVVDDLTARRSGASRPALTDTRPQSTSPSSRPRTQAQYAEAVDIPLPPKVAPAKTTKKRAKKRESLNAVAPLTGDPVRMYTQGDRQGALLTAAKRSTWR